MGLVASGPPISFVANVGTFASDSPDTTLVVVAVSLPNRGLAFRHELNSYQAAYDVHLAFQRDSATILESSERETVRVVGFRETTRTGETIVYRRVFRMAPGTYHATFDVTDATTGRGAVRTATVAVRRFIPGTFARPVVVYQGVPRASLDSAPHYLPRPRASAVFGIDDSMGVYMESYAPGPLTLTLQNAARSILWTRPVPLIQRAGFASGIVQVPLAHADVGVLTLVATHPGSTDSARAALFMGFGPDLPVVSFDQMLQYLQLFATPQRIAALKRTPLAQRGAAWRAFLRATDPNPDTPENEALDAYFARIREANAQFSTDMPRGWLSDRGRVYVALGAPSDASEGYADSYTLGDIGLPLNNRVHVLVWDYGSLQQQIVFYDLNDTGMWRLSPSGLQRFQTLLYRTLAQ